MWVAAHMNPEPFPPLRQTSVRHEFAEDLRTGWCLPVVPRHPLWPPLESSSSVAGEAPWHIPQELRFGSRHISQPDHHGVPPSAATAQKRESREGFRRSSGRETLRFLGKELGGDVCEDHVLEEPASGHMARGGLVQDLSLTTCG